MLRGLGILAGGLAGLGWFTFWPMYQVLNEEPTVTLYFKGILLSAMLVVVGLNLLLLGDKGIPWTKDPQAAKESLTPVQKAVIAASVVAAIGFVAYVWYFFDSHGYKIF